MPSSANHSRISAPARVSIRVSDFTPRLGQRLALFQRHQGRQILLIFQQQTEPAPQNSRSRLRRQRPPTGQCSLSSLNGATGFYCAQFGDLAQRLAETPEPDGQGTLLDNTTILWTNELGKGNSHTLDNIPFVLVGGGLGFKMGRSVRYDAGLPHNRLLMSLAHGFGHRIGRFGNPDFCGAGPLPGLT